MGWLERLNSIKKDSGKTTEDISQLSGIPKGTLNKLFAGQTKDPQLSTIRAVVHCMGYTLDDLDDTVSAKQQEHEQYTEQEEEIIKKYRQLDQRGQQAVSDTLNREFSYLENAAAQISSIAADAIDTIDKITGVTENRHGSVRKK